MSCRSLQQNTHTHTEWTFFKNIVAPTTKANGVKWKKNHCQTNENWNEWHLFSFVFIFLCFVLCRLYIQRNMRIEMTVWSGLESVFIGYLHANVQFIFLHFYFYFYSHYQSEIPTWHYSWRFCGFFFSRYAISECLFVIVDFVCSFSRRRIKISLGQGSRKLSSFLSTFIVWNILKFIAKHVEMSFVAQLAW